MPHPPGAARDDATEATLRARLAEMPVGYTPRTHLWNGTAPAYVNRLIEEGAPYLLQHAHNPVDWWPWGPAALAEAARRDCPIFLSAGYATCHWCHVMEEECFDNEVVAEALNTDFVAIKLDREQRPDIDQIYILATTLQHRHAGWPNSVWLTPDGRPFHSGTYFRPPEFLALLKAIATAWSGQKRVELDRVAGELSRAVRAMGEASAPTAELTTAPEAALLHLVEHHNADEGGFSRATQFPQETYLLFLLDHWRRSGDARALDVALRSLTAMEAGGLHDQIGGGFHRYTVDVNWRTPHFEKMLYTQAQMLACLTEAWEITGQPAFARAAERLVDYLARDMIAPDGAFYTAEDADSLNAVGEREEGAFYCWTADTARDALGSEADRALSPYGLDATPTLEAGAVPHRTPGAPVDAALDPLLERLRKARELRPRPIRDDKIIAGWNGQMIRALADAGQAFERQDWVTLAARAFDAVDARLASSGALSRVHAGGRALEAGNLTDYAWTGLAALALSDAARPGYLDTAKERADELLARFETEGGRLALLRDGAPLGPVLEMEDGAQPSGESSALELLARLDRRLPDPTRRARALAIRDVLSGRISQLPVVRLTALTAARTLDEGESGFRRATDAWSVQLIRRPQGLHMRVETKSDWRLESPPDATHPPIAVDGAEFDESAIACPARSVDGPLNDPGPVVTLTLQVCRDGLCRAPERLLFRTAPC
ncbi:MAG: thioredoxin domain-containing protein [Pseudomonadota bacterium]